MFQLDIQTDISRLVRDVHPKLRRQIPFALAKALTDTAEDSRVEVVRQLPQRFILRNTWVKRGIRKEAATKQTLKAKVYTRDRFMERQEVGGEKRPARRYLAIPVGARRTKRGMITRSQRPRALAAKGNVFMGEIHGHPGIYQRIGRGRSKGGVKLLYALEPQAYVDERWEFEKTVKEEAKRRVDRHFTRSLEYAFRTAK